MGGYMKVENNKIILSYCKNFNRIMNTDFLEGDNISLELVKIYHDFIFRIDLDDEEAVQNAMEIDRIMGKYIDDYSFRKTLQQEMRSIRIKKNVTDVVRAIVLSIISIFKKYELEVTRKIYISKWI